MLLNTAIKAKKNLCSMPKKQHNIIIIKQKSKLEQTKIGFDGLSSVQTGLILYNLVSKSS